MVDHLTEVESRFEPQEMFFSSTDRRGFIRNGNSVFTRVAEFTLEEMRGKPHNLIRHPDMPKSVFKLFWASLLGGKPIAAYVKNRSRTGKYYWVFALAFPFDDGFMSIRIKPSSEILSRVSALYKEILLMEAIQGGDAASERLTAAIRELGFSDYGDFMVRAMAKEMRGRLSDMKVTEDSRLKLIEASRLLEVIHALERQLDDACKSFGEEFSRLKTLSLNMMIKTGAYGAAGKPLAVTSENFSTWGAEIAAVLEQFLERQRGFSSRSEEASRAVNIALMQTEMANFFRRTEPEADIQAKGLDELALGNLQVAVDSIRDLETYFRDFLVALRRLTENLLAMKIVRLNSRVESAHLPDGGAAMNDIVKDISGFISEVETRAKKLSSITREVDVAMRDVLSIGR